MHISHKNLSISLRAESTPMNMVRDQCCLHPIVRCGVSASSTPSFDVNKPTLGVTTSNFTQKSQSYFAIIVFLTNFMKI
jgi:hypothetical protein